MLSVLVKSRPMPTPMITVTYVNHMPYDEIDGCAVFWNTAGRAIVTLWQVHVPSREREQLADHTLRVGEGN